MNDTETGRFVDLIRARLEAITDQNRRGREGQAVVQLDQQAVGRLSRMDALQHQAMARAQQQRRDTESRRLAAALRRIKDGEFGYCATCGDAIPAPRLDLDPAALQCVSCASH